MIAQELEVSLHMAFVEARQARHEFITVEHLLLALLDNPSAAEVLRACAVNIDDLRKTLTNFINDNTRLQVGPLAHFYQNLGNDFRNIHVLVVNGGAGVALFRKKLFNVEKKLDIVTVFDTYQA
jgi:ATP-dependent Clp protease ATP-binding subunit ClpA